MEDRRVLLDVYWLYKVNPPKAVSFPHLSK
jgi:hypothetical protein